MPKDTNERHWVIRNPMGQHAIACGLDAPLQVDIKGHVGFYCGGMNKHAEITIHGHAGVGVAENMMSGVVWVKGNASEVGRRHGQWRASRHRGRCLVALRHFDEGYRYRGRRQSVGHMSAFMAQAGNLVVCGDAGEALGDSIYEARLYVRGKADNLGSDCIEKEMRAEHLDDLAKLLERAKLKHKPQIFRRYGSARKLYNFNVDHADAY